MLPLCFLTFPVIRRCGSCGPVWRRAADHDPDAQLLGKVTDLYFDGDMDASVANTGQVSSRIAELLPVAEIVRKTWAGIDGVLGAARSRM
jgi:enoyl-[acyl-carrier protein] reductase II